MTKISQIVIPNIELNEAIFRSVKIQTEPHTNRVKIKERRRPSGRISILSSFFKTRIKGIKGDKLKIKDDIVPIRENISDISAI